MTPAVIRLGWVLAALLLAVQWSLWFGHGSWPRVRDLQRQLDARQAANADLRSRNQALAAEIASLRQGSEAIEERARRGLHMMRPQETFFELVPLAALGSGGAPGATAVSSQPQQFGME